MQMNIRGTPESRMRGNVQVRFGRGLSEKGGNAPRREPTSPARTRPGSDSRPLERCALRKRSRSGWVLCHPASPVRTRSKVRRQPRAIGGSWERWYCRSSTGQGRSGPKGKVNDLGG